MVIYRVLDEVLRSWSHVAVLRVLIDTDTGYTGNEVARNAGMHPRSALKALSSLEVLGIVRRQRGGRDHLFTLNRNHVLVQDALLPLYATERKFRETIVASLVSVLRGKVVSAVVFGSVALKEETPQSDLDLCCVVRNARQMDVVRNALAEHAQGFYRDFGIKLAPVVFTLDEFRKRSRKPLIREIVSHGQLITGTKPEKLLRG
jgi:predicted nucleotidyltransferase